MGSVKMSDQYHIDKILRALVKEARTKTEEYFVATKTTKGKTEKKNNQHKPMDISEVMRFSEHPFPEDIDDGRTVTVRRGRFWSTLIGGDMVAATTSGGDHIAWARIDDANVWRFDDIPDELIEKNHDPEGRRRMGMLRKMQLMYEGFTPDEYVTVVEYHYA